MKASIIISTFNRQHILRRTLPTILTQDLPRDQYEVIVVDDGSTDGTSDWLQAEAQRSTLRILRQANRGLAAARNTGLRAARGEIVIFVDDDMLCVPGLAGAHIAACDTAPNRASLGPIFLSDDSPGNLASDCFELEIGAFHLSYQQSPGIPLPEDCWVFSNTAVRRTGLLEAGGFDEHLRMSEDAELGFRLTAAGCKPTYSPLAVAYQIYAKSPKDLLRDAAAFAIADRMVMERHPEWRIDSGYEWRGTKPAWRRWVRQIASNVPLLPDAVLSACWLAASGLRGLPPLRKLGVRALQWHRHLIWYRTISAANRGELPCGVQLHTPDNTSNPV